MGTSNNKSIWRDQSGRPQFPSVTQKLLADVKDIVFVIGPDLTPIWTSEPSGTLMGVAVDDWRPGTLLEVVHPDDQEWLKRERQDLLSNPGASVTGRVRVPNADGSVMSVRLTATNHFSDPEINGLVMTVHHTSTSPSPDRDDTDVSWLREEVFSPRAIVDHIATAEDLARECKPKIVAAVQAGVPAQVHGDAKRLQHLLKQLVRASARFVPDGQITIEVSGSSDASLRFVICDGRKGLRPELLSASVTGGLGLDVSAQEAIEALDARLSHKTNAEGTCVILEVRFGPARRIQDRFATPQSPVPETTGARVLVVDDSEVNILLATSQLERLGYTWVTATGGEAALDLLEREHFDAVLMDWHMPGMNGLDATRRWRAEHDPDNQLPIITMTASAMTGDRERCLDAGASDYLPKPVSINDLAAMLSKWTRQRPLEDTRAYDGSTISTLIDDIGDISVVRSMVVAFQNMVPSYGEEARNAFDEGDVPTIRRCAHTLKSTALMLGLADFAVACVTLETAAADGASVDLAERLREFLEQGHGAMEQLQSLLSDLDTGARPVP